MKSWVKVLVVVAIVLIAVQIIKRFSSPGDDGNEKFLHYIATEFETVPPNTFQVTPYPMMVNGNIMMDASTIETQMPMLMQVATDLPSVVPVMVPVATTVPIIPSSAPATIVA